MSSSDSSQLAAVQRQLEEREAVISSGQSRISRLEGLNKLAQVTAMQCEAELSASQASLAHANERLQHVMSELQQSQCVFAVFRHDTAYTLVAAEFL